MINRFLHILLTSKFIHLSFLFLSVILIVFFTYQIFLWQRFKYWKMKNIEQAKPSFPSGNFQDVLLQRKSIGQFLTDLYTSTNTGLIGFYIFHTPHILVRSPDIVKQILVSEFSTFHDRMIASDESADSINSKLLLTVKNPEWKIMRQKVTPIFTTTKIRGMTELAGKVCTEWLTYLDEIYLQGPLETKELCAKLTTDIITSCAFGVEVNSFRNKDAPFREAGRKMIDTTFMNAVRFSCYFFVPFAVRLFRLPLFDWSATTFLRDAFLEIIGHREATDSQPRGDLVDIIIELKKKHHLSDGIPFEGDRVVAQAIQFFAAGFETTSATLSFALYELALNNDLQSELRQSISDIIQNDKKINYDSMLKLPLMNRVFQETLRKYPTLPFIDRRCNKEFTTSSGVIIPSGTPIFISIMGLQYDEEYFPNPDKFDPNRFLPEVAKNRHAFAYLPFGEGPHNCIGERFAMNTMKICLAQLLMKYRVDPCAETPIPIKFSPKSFLLIASKGLPLRFIKL